MWHERDDFKIRFVPSAVNADCRPIVVAPPANAQLPIRSCAQATSTPEGRAERAVEAQRQSAKSVDVAEHSFTLDNALGGRLSPRLRRRLRAALDDMQMHRLDGDEKCRQNAAVIRSVSRLDARELKFLDRSDEDTPRAVSGNGVSDGQEMA